MVFFLIGPGTENELLNGTFNVTEISSYFKFIDELRKNVSDVKGTDMVTVNNKTVPMLPPECGNKYFRIILISDNSRITIQIQQVNLYLVAFQGANDTWYEFKHKGNITKYVNNSVMLNFTASYPANKILEKIPVGLENLQHAISGLAKYNHKDRSKNDIQPLLVRLMVMIPEAIRFSPVKDLFSRNKQVGTMLALFKNWGKISSAIWLYAQNGTFNYSQPVVEYVNITTVDQAVSIVRILLYQKNKKPPKQPKKEAAATAVAVVKMKKTSKLPKAVAAGVFDLQPQEFQRVPNTCPRGSHFKAPCSCHHLIQEDHTFDHCMVGDWWKYSKPANITNTCSAAQD